MPTSCSNLNQIAQNGSLSAQVTNRDGSIGYWNVVPLLGLQFGGFNGSYFYIDDYEYLPSHSWTGDDDVVHIYTDIKDKSHWAFVSGSWGRSGQTRRQVNPTTADWTALSRGIQSCLNSMFGAILTGGDSARAGHNGFSDVTWTDTQGNTQTARIIADATKKTANDLTIEVIIDERKKKPSNKPISTDARERLDIGKGTLGLTYTNYPRYTFVASNANYYPILMHTGLDSVFGAFATIQVHELGNAVAILTNNYRWHVEGRKPDPDSGFAFGECVQREFFRYRANP